MLGILLRLVLVEHGDDLPHHDLGWIVAEFLRDRNELHAMLRQLT
jgi:hypothetical protein